MASHLRLMATSLATVAGLTDAAAIPLAPPPTRADRHAPMTDFARDVDRVESVRAVKSVQYAFAHALAAGDWHAAATLFARDGLLVDGTKAEARGLAEIDATLQRTIGNGMADRLAPRRHFEMFMSPIVTLSRDGETARGRWHMIGLAGGPGRAAAWSGGIFEIDYRREDGAWRIARQEYHPFLSGTYAAGWHSATAELPMIPYRHDPTQIGTPVLLGGESGPANGHVTRALAARVMRLGAEDAVRNLQNAYGYYFDRKMWDDVIDLFSADASLDIVGEGRYEGPAGIRRKLLQSGPAQLRYGELNDHIQTDLMIDVSPDGRQARARGFDLGMVGRNEGQGSWSITEFDNLYALDRGIWRIRQMRQITRMKTAAVVGPEPDWGADRMLAATPAPDRPAPIARRRRPAREPWRAVAWAARPAASPTIALRAAAAYDAIENLSGAYAQYIDDAQWDSLAGLFAAQGERDSAGGGFIRTPARIASFSATRYGAYNPHRRFTSMHIRTQPVIHVSADAHAAQERTRLFQVLIGAADAPPAKYESGMLMTGMYEDDVVFENNAWRFKRVDLDHLLYTLDYRHGWTRIPEGTGKLLDPPLATDVTFDAPGMGDTYPPFPKVGHMWFHYRNPVSGRVPVYLMPKYAMPEP